MKNPIVTVIIPYRDDRGFLKEAIDSVLNQDYNGEIQLILSQSNNGLGFNINRGLKLAKGEFIKLLADDDVLTKNCISDGVNKLRQGFDFIHSNAYTWYYDSDNRMIFKPRLTNPGIKDMVLKNEIHGGTTMYRADIFKNIGKFDETLFTGEEYDFNMSLLNGGAKLGYLDKVTMYYRRHGKQKSLGNNNFEYQMKRKKEIEMIKSRYGK